MTTDEHVSKIEAYGAEFLRAYTEFFDKYSSDVLAQASDLAVKRVLLPFYGRRIGVDTAVAALYTQHDFYLYFLDEAGGAPTVAVDASADADLDRGWTFNAPGSAREATVARRLSIDRQKVLALSPGFDMVNIGGTNFLASSMDAITRDAYSHGNNFASQAATRARQAFPEITRRVELQARLHAYTTRYEDLLASSEPRQVVGQRFEVLWRDVLSLYGWQPRKTRIPGEENDFTASYHGLHVLGEVRWYKEPMDGGKLREFLAKLNARPMTVGLFISHSGIDDGAVRVMQRNAGSNPAVVFARDEIDRVLIRRENPGPIFDRLLRDVNDYLYERPT